MGGDADYGRIELQGAVSLKHSRQWSKFCRYLVALERLGNLTEKMLMYHSLKSFSWEVPNLRVGITVMQDQTIYWDEPVGGNSFSYASLEYTFKIADPLRFACSTMEDFYAGEILNFLLVVVMRVGMTIGVWVFVSW